MSVSKDAGAAGRIDAVDGLRGLAILSVIAWHYVFCGLPRDSETPIVEALRSTLWLSWSGVHLFFVVSGFLIGRNLLAVREAPRYYRTFYARRALRIVPLYALVVALTLGLRALEPARLGWLLGGASPPWWQYATFLQTIWMVQHGGFGMTALGVTWSLAIEEQFYLFAPGLVRGVPRRMLPWLLGALVIGAPALRAWLVLGPSPQPFTAYVAMPCRVDALALGMLVACAMESARGRALLVRWRAAFVLAAMTSLLVLALCVVRVHVRLNSPEMLTWGFSVLGVLYASMLVLVLTGPEGLFARVAATPALVELGKLCFGLYLFHELVLGLCHGIIFGRQPLLGDAEDCWITLLAFLLTFALARASWRVLERPLIARGHRLRYR